MQMEETMERIVAVCRKHDADRIILFGLRAKGTALERNDIDIAVSDVEDFRTMQEEEGYE